MEHAAALNARIISQAQEFVDTKGFYIRRTNHKQNVKDVCTYCRTWRGCD